MKKLFLFSISLILPLTTISCINTTSKERKEKKIRESLSSNLYIKEMLNVFSNNDINKKSIYVSQQENKSNSKINELRYAFVFYPPFIIDAINKNPDYKFLAKKSKDAIQKTLSQDWYWSLMNIDKFNFNFNPYGDRYKNFKKEEEWFENVKRTFGTLIMNIKNPRPEKLINIQYKENLKVAPFNVYSDKEIYYLVYDGNKAIKIWKYKENGEIKYQIVPDLLVFNNPSNEKSINIESLLENLESKIFEKRISHFEAQYKKNKEDAKAFGEEFNEEEFLKRYLDKFYMKFQEKFQYNGFLHEVLNEINKDYLKVYRFSMRSIYEKK
ncbi:hypothetical protein DMC14_000990 [Metamycoplasma phocicerebrale]|uniref:Lipoprotein n=1 Tax=Metamycoplasma phocicerebrale TaxID=142649 RepID=A0A3T0TTS0_9BACT|nr:aromatic motif membrane protein [Metamycoplasma phocicerebrale]AZZ65369.1 hypothetical protein DMC14_000990 [Metamycoplasma phocicerebrale]